MIADSADVIAKDGWLTVQGLALYYNVSYQTTHNILCEDLDLSKKSVRGWDKIPVHTTAMVRNGLAVHTIPLLQQASYSHELIPLDLFLIPILKELLAGPMVATSSVYSAAEGVADYDCIPVHIAVLA